ncbi:MAG: transcriptional repressor [Chitinispirillaceae bacterium]|nr:transcriptional repressor [Chitinispirillaceae bacterium]
MNVESAQKKKFQIENSLRKQGFSITNQRSLIIAEILHNGPHFDVESLAAGMHMKNSNTARATIYRTVKILVDTGMIKREMLGDTHSHYEIAERDHGHFVCISCGKIIELACPTLTGFLATVAESHDFTIDQHSIELFGRCGDCQRKRRIEEAA